MHFSWREKHLRYYMATIQHNKENTQRVKRVVFFCCFCCFLFLQLGRNYHFIVCLCVENSCLKSPWPRLDGPPTCGKPHQLQLSSHNPCSEPGGWNSKLASTILILTCPTLQKGKTSSKVPKGDILVPRRIYDQVVGRFTKCQSPAFGLEGSRRVTRGATLGAFSTIKLPGVCSPFECVRNQINLTRTQRMGNRFLQSQKNWQQYCTCLKRKSVHQL